MKKFWDKHRLVLVGLLLTLAVFAVYGPVRNYGLLDYDDDEYVSANPHVRGGLTGEGIAWAFSTGYASNWHPLTWISHMLDIELFGSNAGGYHLHNVLLHLLSTLLLFVVLNRMTGAFGPSAFVAALFALHPLHVESVAWIAERKDVLSAVFLFATIGAYARYVRRPSPGRYWGTMALYALGLMAKPMLVTLPFVLLLLDVWPLERTSFGTSGSGPIPDPAKPIKVSSKPGKGIRKKPGKKDLKIGRSAAFLLREKIPFFLLAAASSLVTYAVQRGGGSVATGDVIPLGMRILNALGSSLDYMIHMFVPAGLAVFYPFPKAGELSVLKAGVAVLIIAAATYAAVRLMRAKKYLFTGWFWYLGMLVPVIGLVQVGSQSRADRYTYLPLIGLFILLVWGIREIFPKGKRWNAALVGSGIVGLAVLAFVARRQVGYWRDTVTLFEHTLQVTDRNFLIANNLGSLYGKLGRWEDARNVCLRSLEYKPDYPGTYYNLGLAYANLGRAAESIASYREAIRFQPDFPSAHFNLGNSLGAENRWEEAAAEYEETLRLSPDHAGARNNLGAAYLRLKRFPEAAEAFERAAVLEPNFPGIQANLGLVYQALGRWPEAQDALEKAVRSEPGNASSYFGLGYSYFRTGRFTEAVAALKNGLEIQPADGEAHFLLGMAYLRLGDKVSAGREADLLEKTDEARASRIREMIRSRSPSAGIR